MMKENVKLLFFLTALLFSKSVFAQEVNIGTQVWMTKNLNVDKFRNGDPIPEAKTNKEWLAAGENQHPAWAYYDNDPSNGEKYGKLYNWYAVNDPRGLAPEGWHVPSIEEWNTLIKNLDGKSTWRDNSFAGEQLKSNFGWKENVNSNLNSGFLALPGGFRDFEGRFFSMYYHGYWWSSDEVSNHQFSPFVALYVNIHTSKSPVHAGLVQSKGIGYSVRCIKGDGVTFTEPRDAVIDLSKLNSEVNEEEEREIVDVTFDVVEIQPEFPGGLEGWNKYLAENIKYPEVAKKMGVQGTVIVVFVITKDGSIKDVTVLRGIGGGCDEEAIRVVKNGPKWEPGKQRGEPVNTRMRLPMKFKLG